MGLDYVMNVIVMIAKATITMIQGKNISKNNPFLSLLKYHILFKNKNL